LARRNETQTIVTKYGNTILLHQLIRITNGSGCTQGNVTSSFIIGNNSYCCCYYYYYYYHIRSLLIIVVVIIIVIIDNSNQFSTIRIILLLWLSE
jgi:hypothetical protein